MKFLKLGLISLVAFSLLILGFTLLFPANTIISRAINIAGNADTMAFKLKSNEVSIQQLLADTNRSWRVQAADIPFYEDNLFNQRGTEAVTNGDTVFFRIVENSKMLAEGGVAFYQLSPDTATTQLFYVFQTPWYKPLAKMKMMMADKAMGASLEATLKQFKQQAVR